MVTKAKSALDDDVMMEPPVQGVPETNPVDGNGVAAKAVNNLPDDAKGKRIPET